MRAYPTSALATALERSLQAFAKPWNRVRAIDVFRDQSNLSSIGGLASGVTRGIDESEFLILLACPRVGEVLLGHAGTHALVADEIHRENRARAHRRSRTLGSEHWRLRLGEDHRLS
jgi:hypothetical protein